MFFELIIYYFLQLRREQFKIFNANYSYINGRRYFFRRDIVVSFTDFYRKHHNHTITITEPSNLQISDVEYN